MRHAVKLETIPADGDSSSQKNIQVHSPFTALIWFWYNSYPWCVALGLSACAISHHCVCMQCKQCHEQ
jgi:hypothetical protein